jgi:hypothetical protein
MLFRPNLLSTYASGKSELLPFFLQYFYIGIDPILTWMCQNFLPEYLGCQLVGPWFDMTNPIMSRDFQHRKLGIYVWTVNNTNYIPMCNEFRMSYGTDYLHSYRHGASFAAGNNATTPSTPTRMKRVDSDVDPPK